MNAAKILTKASILADHPLEPTDREIFDEIVKNTIADPNGNDASKIINLGVYATLFETAIICKCIEFLNKPNDQNEITEGIRRDFM